MGACSGTTLPPDGSTLPGMIKLFIAVSKNGLYVLKFFQGQTSDIISHTIFSSTYMNILKQLSRIAHKRITL